MFEVGLLELAVIGLVALLVLGPERLPRAARTVGLYVRKARQSWYSVRADIERELAADELRRSLKRAEETVREAATVPDLGLPARPLAAPSTPLAQAGDAVPPEPTPDASPPQAADEERPAP